MGSIYQSEIAQNLLPIVVSVSTSASASVPTGYRGFFFGTSASLTFVCVNGTSVAIDNFPKNTFLWVQAAYVTILATATSIYGIV